MRKPNVHIVIRGGIVEEAYAECIVCIKCNFVNNHFTK